MNNIQYYLIANIIISVFHVFTLIILIKKSSGKVTVEKVASSAKDAVKAIAAGLGVTCFKDIVNAVSSILGKGSADKEEQKEVKEEEFC